MDEEQQTSRWKSYVSVIEFIGEMDIEFREWLEAHPDAPFLNVPSARSSILMHKPSTSRGCPFKGVSRYSAGALTRPSNGYFKVAGKGVADLIQWATVERPGWTVRTCKKCFPFESLVDLADGHDDSVVRDIWDIESREGVDSTTRRALIDARLGQGRFRSDMLRLWDGRCAVTGCGVTSTLTASHAKPWAHSTDVERLNAHNGLLLVATLDRLFDRYLIAFDPMSGEMQVSPSITHADRSILGVPARLTRTPTPEQANFLRIQLDAFKEKARRNARIIDLERP